MGVKVQCALYPIKQSLLAPYEGIIVETAANVNTRVNRNNTQYPFFLIFIYFMKI
jgi:hypothetical protein